MNNMEYTVRSGIYGQIVGDALGVPYEFLPREDRDKDPCTTMVGYGSHQLPKGSWSDDSSMTLAGLDGLRISLEKNRQEKKISDIIDYEEVMMKYIRWYALSEYTPYGFTWGVGFATDDAMNRYLNGTPPCECGGTDERDNGNGSIMRMLPIAMFIHYMSKEHSFSIDEMMEIVHGFTSLTHGHLRSKMACGTYVLIALEILKNSENEEKESLETLVDNGLTKAINYYYMLDEFEEETPHFKRVYSRHIHNWSRDKINSGGYVLSTLEATVWCLLNNDNYCDSVLEAVNLGYDTDTTACVVGGLAGLYYGFDDIPKSWVDCIVECDFIDSLVTGFCDAVSF